MTTTATRRRAGFTLVELLAVIALMIVLATLTVAVLSSGAIGSQRVVTSADKASGWLLIAKNRAARDRAPRGVRFYRNTDPLLVATSADAANPGYFVAEAQYIDGTGGLPYVPNPKGDPNGARLLVQRTLIAGTPFTEFKYRVFAAIPNVAAETTRFESGVLNGMLLLSPDLSRALRVDSGNPLTPPWAVVTQGTDDPIPNDKIPNVIPGGLAYKLYELTISTADRQALTTDFGAGYSRFDGTSNPTGQDKATFSTLLFAFQPQPQPLFGEPVLQMGSDVVIDARPDSSPTPTNLGNLANANSFTRGYFDVIFAPSGEVLGQSGGLIALWIRDPNRGTGPYDFNDAGEQVLVVVYTRTGAVATQPVNQDAAAPFKFAKDGINAGF